jgi:iron complex transport system substrate-binding protein
VRQKPVISRSIVSDDLRGVEIDQLVAQTYHAQTYHRGGSIYHLDPQFLEQARPDLIIAQELCQMCAVTSDEARRTAELARSGAQILWLQPRTLQEVLGSIQTLGQAVGREPGAKALVDQLQARITFMTERLAGIFHQPRVLCLGWLAPLMAEGHWIPELVRLAGGRDELGQAGEHSCRLSWEEVVVCAPEVIILMPCSFSLARTLAEAPLLGEFPGWNELLAVQAGQVYAVDSGYFSRPGPRLITGLAIIAHCLHPERMGEPLPVGAVARL